MSKIIILPSYFFSKSVLRINGSPEVNCVRSIDPKFPKIKSRLIILQWPTTYDSNKTLKHLLKPKFWLDFKVDFHSHNMRSAGLKCRLIVV